MTIDVRIFAHGELAVAPVGASSSRYSTDSLFLAPPYIGREKLTVGTVAAVSSDQANAPVGTVILRVEVPAGKVVAYEINRRNADTPRVADSSSPTLEGRMTLYFGEGWTVSMLDVTP